MPLKSKLFKGDPKLEAAAVSNAAHIVPGASGTHVAKIQRALNILDQASLDEDGAYGSETASAVLRYKQKRRIINKHYQTQPDNIVGIMTISTMDHELSPDLGPTVIIGQVATSSSHPSHAGIRSFVPALGAPLIGATVGLRAVIRGNPYVSQNASQDDGMPASIPPGKTYMVQVTVTPPLVGGEFIELAIINTSAANGNATISPARISQSALVTVTGVVQTEPGNAGKLQIQAKLNGSIVKATSDGFSVCAHVSGLQEEFREDIDNTGGVGIRVRTVNESDSGNLADLTQAKVSEVVDNITRNEPPFGGGSGFVNNSKYLQAIPPAGKIAVDDHVEPRPSAGPKGMAEKLQLHMFMCLRCGATDKAVPNSGFDIIHTVTQEKGEWVHRVTKTGAEIGIKLPDSGVILKSKAGKGKPMRSKDHKLS
jgi:peptidoglycan hydrolase-like protein with peptidoglycan-binding domain